MAVVQGALADLVEGRDLDSARMQAVMQEIMTGACSPAQVAGVLIALRMKGETVEEITAAASVMRALATRVQCSSAPLLDIVGTGGDASGTFNVSTASSFIAAAAGAHVAKHGNRSVSSRSGAADLLETAGVNLDLNPAHIARCIDEVGVGFMFAQKHHSAMRHAIGPRREMAVRTMFNVLGPLTNPAFATRQVIGVYAPQWVEPLAQVLKGLGSERALVVHSDDGMDEISVSAPTQAALLSDGEVRLLRIEPSHFGISLSPHAAVQVDSPEASLQMVRGVLQGESGAASDMVSLNAGAGLYVAGLADSLADGVTMARETIASGAGLEKLDALATLSQQLIAQGSQA